MENIFEASVQSDSRREAVFETPASDGDSGDSLFVTQSVTPASRTVKRHRLSKTQARPFSQESEDEREREGNPGTWHEVSSDADSEADHADLLCRWKSLVKTPGRTGRQPRPRRLRASPKRTVLPFLKASGSRQLSQRQNKAIANSEIGGFFKCLLKLSKGHGERRLELDPSELHSHLDVSENEEDNENVEGNEDDDDDEDVWKVDTDCFILGGHKRIRQTWLPSLKCKKGKTPRKCAMKRKNRQKEPEKGSEIGENGGDLMEPQDAAEIHNESSSFNVEESQCKQSGRKSRKSRARSSLSPCRLSPDKSPFVQSLFTDQQVEHGENQPQVLVTCSQSQSGWHQAQKSDQARESMTEPIDETAVEETQWPSLTNQDDHETQILEDNPSFHEDQVREKDIHEGVRCELVEDERLGSLERLGGWSSSQDLFQEPNHQASPLKDASVENDNEGLESHQMLHDDIDSGMKKRNRLILADVEADHVISSKSQRTQPTKIVSPTARDVLQERKENNKKVSDESVERVYPTRPLEDGTSRSRGNDLTSPCNDILTERQAETPLFTYGGLKFLIRRKGKKPKAPKIPDTPTLAPCQNEGSASHIDDTIKLRKRKKGKNDELLEEPAGTLPEIGVPADSSHDSSVVSASAGGSKAKTKRKKDKHDQPVPQKDQWIGAEKALQIPCPDCDSLVSVVRKTEQRARTDISSPILSHEVKQLDSNTQINGDLVPSDGLKSKRKKKKEVKKRESGPVIPDEVFAPQCSEEPHLRHGAKTVKRKKQKFIDDGEMTTGIQPVSCVDLNTGDSVTPRRKKKKRKRQEEVGDVEASLVETTDQVESPDTFLDSEQHGAEVVLVKKFKKMRKEKKDRTETSQGEKASENATVALGPGLEDTATSDTPSTRSETGATGEEEGLGGSEPMKKKKRKELENDESVSCNFATSCHAEGTTVVDEALSLEQKRGKNHPAPCLEKTTNGDHEKKNRGKIKDDAFGCSQQVLRAEDTIPPERKKKNKKKKKRLIETDVDVHAEIVERDMCQESGSPSEPPEATVGKKKKKNRKDTDDAGENKGLGVPSELSAADGPRDVLVTGHAKEDRIVSLGGEMLVNIKKKKKKKKQGKDSENDLDITIRTEQS